MLPAYAGMIQRREHDGPARERAPRVCGDDPRLWQVELVGQNRAPRVCGDDPRAQVAHHAHDAVLPAYAGMIQANLLQEPAVHRAPRVCGDDPLILGASKENIEVLPAYAGMILGSRNQTKGTIWCSPRMRG